MVLIELRKIFSLHVRFANFFHQLGFDITHTLYFIFLAVVRKAYVQTYVRYKKSVYNAPKKFYTKYKKKKKKPWSRGSWNTGWKIQTTTHSRNAPGARYTWVILTKATRMNATVAFTALHTMGEVVRSTCSSIAG